MVELSPAHRPLLPATKISSGDIVRIYRGNAQASSFLDSKGARTDSSSSSSSSSQSSGALDRITGVVTRITDKSLVVSIDQDLNNKDSFHQVLGHNASSKSGHAKTNINKDRKLYRVDRVINDVTYRKIREGLTHLLAAANDDTTARLQRVLFQNQAPGYSSCPAPSSSSSPSSGVTGFFSQTLNKSQKEAIDFALRSKDIALIHGPPGTGKTTTVVELCRQIVSRGERILLCAPSNIAVDNVVEKLVDDVKGSSLKVVRLGHPARLSSQILSHSLDAKIRAAEGTSIILDIRDEISKAQSEILSSKDKEKRKRLRRLIKDNRRELRERESKVVQQVLKNCDIVCCTTVGAASSVLRELKFDVTVIDEAAQGLEAACWIPIMKAPRCVLAGDHCQLPPTIKSDAAARGGLEITLFDRVIKMYGSLACRMLDTQYRMHQSISEWVSSAMYNESLEDRMQKLDLEKIDDKVNCTFLLLDTEGLGLEEVSEESSESKSNPGEARVVERHVRALLDLGLRQTEVAVITPYNGQVDLLRSMMKDDFPQLEIRSVDGFQGCEKEAVVLSLVRSNEELSLGFLKDRRRLNVAVSRARRHCAVVCDSHTVRSDTFIASLLNHIEAHGEVRSAAEYMEESMVQVSDWQSFHIEVQVEEKPLGAPEEAQETKELKTEERQQKKDVTKVHQAEDKKKVGRNTDSTPESTEKNKEIPGKKEEVEVKDGTGHVDTEIGGRSTEQGEKEATERQNRKLRVIPQSERAQAGEADQEENKQQQQQQQHQNRQTTPGSTRKDTQTANREQSVNESKTENTQKGENDKNDDQADANALLKTLHEERRQRELAKRQRESKGKAQTHMSTATTAMAGNEWLSVSAEPKETTKKKSKNKKKNKKKTSEDKGQSHTKAEPASQQAKEPKEQRKGERDRDGKLLVKAKKEEEKKTEDHESEDEEWKILEAEASKNRFCSWGRMSTDASTSASASASISCRAKVDLLGSTCKFCHLRFCLKHALAETHGCGQKARKSAREQNKKQAATATAAGRNHLFHQGTRADRRTWNDQRRSLLKQQLDKKLEEEAGKRQVKHKDKKTDKR